MLRRRIFLATLVILVVLVEGTTLLPFKQTLLNPSTLTETASHRGDAVSLAVRQDLEIDRNQPAIFLPFVSSGGINSQSTSTDVQEESQIADVTHEAILTSSRGHVRASVLPIINETIKLTATNGHPGDLFGTAVAISGDLAIVGAPKFDANGDASGTNHGAAYVFERNQDGSDSWVEIATLTAAHADTDVGDQFGSSVAISGDVAIVGAFYDDDIHGTNSGSAYIFERTQDGSDQWVQVRKLANPTGAQNDQFGISVAISGDVAIVGAHQDDTDNNITNSGSVYIFERNEGGSDNWGQIKKLSPTADGTSDGIQGDHFGRSVAMSGDLGIVGAYKDSVNFGNPEGSAYIFGRDQDGTNQWGQVVKLSSSNLAAHDHFGISVAIDDDAAIVGAFHDDDHGSRSGSAYIFERNHNGIDNWGEVTRLTASDAAMHDQFGHSVAISGDLATVGVLPDDPNAPKAGSVYIFERNEGGIDNWGEVAKLTALDGHVNDEFGYAVAASGDAIIIGARSHDDVDNGIDAGAAYVYSGVQDPLDGQPEQLTVADGNPGDQFGTSVAINADVAIVGAPKVDGNGGAYHGAAYVFERYQSSGDSWTQSTKLTAADAQAGDHFGRSVAISGNMAIVGAFYDDDNGSKSGSAYVFERSQDGTNVWSQVAKLTSPNGAKNDEFGISVAINGDIAIVGSHQDDNPFSNAGAAYVFGRNQGGTNSWGLIKSLVADDVAKGDRFGRSVAISGDLVIVGANQHRVTYQQAGSAYIFGRNEGGTDNWGQVARLAATDPAANDYFGISVAISGDTAIVGAYHNDDHGSRSGSAYMFGRTEGGTDNWGQVKKLTAPDAAADDQFGHSVAISGDLAIVGAHLDDDGDSDSGSAYMFGRDQGGTDNWGFVNKLMAPKPAYNDRYGYAVAISGDVTIIGAYLGDSNGQNSGSAYVDQYHE